jgi:hypothetical protein
MSINMFDSLPFEIQDIILKRKDDLETATYQDFLESFEVKVLSRKGVLRTFGTKLKYVYRLRLHYKPLNKFMLTTYQDWGKPKNVVLAEDIIGEMAHNMELFNNECDYAFENQYEMKWSDSISYDTYVSINSLYAYDMMSPMMSLKQFCEWRRKCSDFKRMLGSRYDTFMEV